MKKIFVAQEDYESGLIGLIEPNAPEEFRAGLDILIAHDCIEHFKGDDGSVDREFMAFGCMIWVRAYNGYFINPYTQKNILKY